MGSASLEAGGRHQPQGRSGEGRAGIGLVWTGLAIALPALASLAASIRMVDLAYHVRVGDLMLETGTLLRSEALSFVGAGDPWLNQQWLAQLILAGAHRAGGVEALALLRALALAGLAGTLFLACRRRGVGKREASLLSIAGIVVGFPSLALRPQLFGALLFAASLWLLVSMAEHPRRRWWLVPIGVVWANVHGSFVLLPALVALATVQAAIGGRRADVGRLVGAGLVASAATLVTPYGPGTWRYALDLINNAEVRRQVTEWAPIALDSVDGWLFFGSGVVVLAVLIRRGREVWIELLWLVPFFALGWSARRNVVWWGLVAAWVVAGMLGETRSARTERRDMPVLNLAIVSTLAAGFVALSPWVRGVALEDAPAVLSSAAREATPSGARVLVAQRYASWFELALPDRPVFVDSRIERFSPEVWDEYRSVVRGDPAWRDIVDRWKVDAIVTERGWPLVTRLRSDPGWQTIEQDGDGSVFVRA